MNAGHRVRAIYRKELIDILRDRRTLIAMIVVPIVLYPLLMLGSIQALSLQSEKLEGEKISVTTLDEGQRDLLLRWIGEDYEVVQVLRSRQATEGQAEEGDEALEPEDPERWEVSYVESGLHEEIRQAIRSRQVQLGVVVGVANPGDRLQEQYAVTPMYDPEDFRSASAYLQFRRLVERRLDRVRGDRLARLSVPPIVIVPIVSEPETVSTPGSVLGQILPLVLVLMTITGAIYPAIDLTAGERERGTLETLMVCPVPVVDLVVGKFLVVTTVALMGAALNLASVSATVYFGGFEAVVAAPGDEGFPLAALPLILLALVPFAILMSAIMMAVCSYARTFKEAQNYVTPVILAVLIPGGVAALPATRLEGSMLVMPVGNMVLLTRELLMGSIIEAHQAVWVLLSTTLYAAAAVAVAARVFGAESVVFSDTASLRTVFRRRLMRLSDRPGLATAVLAVALLFPVWFYVQALLQAQDDFAAVLRDTGRLMPVFFVLLPAAVCWYFKIAVRPTFALRWPRGRYLLAAVLLGLTAWVPAQTLTALQLRWIALPEALQDADHLLTSAITEMSPWLVLLLLALVPAVCEEALFRGFLLSGLRASLGKWSTILATALAFALFHYYVFKVPVTAFLGVLLGYLCWQSRSIVPAVVMHALHNTTTVSLTLWPQLPEALRIDEAAPTSYLPLHVLVPAGVLFVAGVLAAVRSESEPSGVSGDAR
jgi:ABC-type Na+ efflux pump permease subunit/membrane protease YdiL (CAAX protease family)